ncbi:NAD dependent epimerase/dehydratase family protein [Cooperia oncophora]
MRQTMTNYFCSSPPKKRAKSEYPAGEDYPDSDDSFNDPVLAEPSQITQTILQRRDAKHQSLGTQHHPTQNGVTRSVPVHTSPLRAPRDEGRRKPMQRTVASVTPRRFNTQVWNLSRRDVAHKTFPDVRFRNEGHRKRILVTGGAGFVGSHLVDKLMMDGHEVIALDNYFTGRKRNVERWIGHPNFELVHHDVWTKFITWHHRPLHLTYMYNPPRYCWLRHRRFTVDPEVHPQPESYWGHVNTIGPRSCYDEGKRVAESLMVAYNKQERVPIRIARIFNTFGPRMHMNDGRVVSNFIIQALQGNPITIYGDGSQTRSFQYVDDLVDGLILLMNSNCSLPVNIGNPEEYSISDFARIIKDLVGSESSIVNKSSQEDDPQQRRPDISRAAKELKWQPQVDARVGLIKTIEYFRDEINEHRRLSSANDD